MRNFNKPDGTSSVLAEIGILLLFFLSAPLDQGKQPLLIGDEPASLVLPLRHDGLIDFNDPSLPSEHGRLIDAVVGANLKQNMRLDCLDIRLKG